ncbi:MAG: hypothetical protein H6703_06395 [Myxococcales bacterium]|nr:hypothetical protein [Myxococcales bacterium]
MNDPTNTHRIRAALDALQVPVPGAVARYVVEAGSTRPTTLAVWVYVIVNDDKIAPLQPQWRKLRWDIYEAIARVMGSTVNPYIRMRAASELTEPGARAS